MQLWQVGLIMQHKGKTNRLYLRRLAIIYYAHSYHRTVTAVQPIHFLSIQSFTLASFIMRGVAALTYSLVSVLCIHISRHGNIAPHISLYGPPHKCCPKRRRTGPYYISHGVRSRNTHIQLAHTFTPGGNLQSQSAELLRLGKLDHLERPSMDRTQKPLIKKARSVSSVCKMAARTQRVLSCSSSPPTEGYSRKSILSLIHIQYGCSAVNLSNTAIKFTFTEIHHISIYHL